MSLSDKSECQKDIETYPEHSISVKLYRISTNLVPVITKVSTGFVLEVDEIRRSVKIGTLNDSKRPEYW